MVAFETLQLVLEPGGAAGLAALLAGRVPGFVPGQLGKQVVVVVASGVRTQEQPQTTVPTTDLRLLLH